MNPAFLTIEQLQERLTRLLSMYASLIEQEAFREAQAVRRELRAVQGELLIRNQRQAA